MRDKHRLIYAAITVSLFLLSGCGLLSNSDGSHAETVKSEKPENPKELGVITVIDRAVKQQEEKKGLELEFKMDQKMDMMVEGQKQNLDMSMDMWMQGSQNSEDLHMKGNAKINGGPIPLDMEMEIYQVDGMVYTKIGKMGWMKEKEDQEGESVQSPQSSDIMTTLAKMFKSIGGEAIPKGIIMTKENGHYRVEITKAFFLKNQEMQKELLSMVESRIEDLKKDGVQIKEDQIQFNEFNQVVYIDEDTFEYDRMELISNFTIPTEKDGDVNLEQKIDAQFKGEFKGEIVVPEEAKK
ncbi:hypothetical protein IC619_004520 [Hazenella sp. IB182353]|uniref:DUF6612 family protein n=1 Tax=Polycladospora coralii TaxID=2771432 RepID=UPI00174790F2|nr:DUF6612 family protein [Polycladospora coralii]MBS7529760.1 hypothetical protein [Polycladospora coralii]